MGPGHRKLAPGQQVDVVVVRGVAEDVGDEERQELALRERPSGNLVKGRRAGSKILLQHLVEGRKLRRGH